MTDRKSLKVRLNHTKAKSKLKNNNDSKSLTSVSEKAWEKFLP